MKAWLEQLPNKVTPTKLLKMGLNKVDIKSLVQQGFLQEKTDEATGLCYYEACPLKV